jgi:tRNA threonylcarbamoyladenosine biosynthesis protein TsaE
VVEWPERAGELLAAPDLEISLTFQGTGRRARLVAHTESGRHWLSFVPSPA